MIFHNNRVFCRGRSQVRCQWLSEELKQAVFDSSSSSSSLSSSTLHARFEDEEEHEDEMKEAVCVPTQVITRRTSHWREGIEQQLRFLPVEAVYCRK